MKSEIVDGLICLAFGAIALAIDWAIIVGVFH